MDNDVIATQARDPADGSGVGRLSVPKAGDVLADQLRRRIRSGELCEGQALPTERKLVQETGLSRLSVREALRILETEGLIETRPGRNGGSHVRRPEGNVLARHLELFIWSRNASPGDVHDVREALEALAAETAARRRTAADLAELTRRTEALEASVGDSHAYLAANVDWHMAIIKASHNELLIGLMSVLARVLHDATSSDAFDSPDVRAATVAVHRNILEAITEGDASAARDLMLRDVTAARTLAVGESLQPASGAIAAAPPARRRSRATS